MHEDNGILAIIPGQYIGAALQSLPDPDSTQAEQIVEIEIDHIGRIRLYIERRKARLRKHSHWYWATYRAEKIG